MECLAVNLYIWPSTSNTQFEIVFSCLHTAFNLNGGNITKIIIEKEKSIFICISICDKTISPNYTQYRTSSDLIFLVFMKETKKELWNE